MAERNLESRFGEWIRQGVLLYKNNFLVLFVVTLLAWVISSFIAGIVAGPMLAGLVMLRLHHDLLSLFAHVLMAYMVATVGSIGFAVLGGPMFAGLASVTLGLLDGKKPKPGIGDLFKGFQHFVNAFLFVAAWGVIHAALQGIAPLILSPLLLPVVPVILSVVTGTLSMFGLFLIVDRKMPFRKAFVEGIRLAGKSFWLYAAAVLVAGAISMAGMILCGVGVVVTAPVYGCVIAVVYRDTVKSAG